MSPQRAGERRPAAARRPKPRPRGKAALGVSAWIERAAERRQQARDRRFVYLVECERFDLLRAEGFEDE